MGFLGQKMAAMMAVVVYVAMMAAAARGQSIPSCASNLVPCAQYLNSTNPPETCCGPLRDTVKNQLSCLCALYKSPDILKAFDITLDKALQLSRHCGLTSNLTACDTGAPAPASNPPPASSGGGKSAHRATWFGATGLTSLFFFWWSILA